MAVGAIVAVIHDVLISVGVYSIFEFEVTPATVIAFLTILGYSLYDTIVVFDKVNENQSKVLAPTAVTYTDMVNLSLNQVLMRSLNTIDRRRSSRSCRSWSSAPGSSAPSPSRSSASPCSSASSSAPTRRSSSPPRSLVVLKEREPRNKAHPRAPRGQRGPAPRPRPRRRRRRRRGRRATGPATRSPSAGGAADHHGGPAARRLGHHPPRPRKKGKKR